MSATNELKTKYQRNMIFGMVANIILSAIAFFWFYTPPPDVRDYRINDYMPPGINPVERSHLAKTGLGGKGSNSFPIAALAKKFTIIPDMPIASGQSSPPNFVIRPALEILNPTDQSDLAEDIADWYGYIPDDADSGLFSRSASGDNYLDFSLKNLSMRGEIQVGGNYFPLKIRFAYQPTPPENAADSEALVIMKLKINKKGKILEFTTEYESPPDLGFAQQFRQALSRAMITPEKFNNQYFGGEYRIFWKYYPRTDPIIRTRNTSQIQVAF